MAIILTSFLKTHIRDEYDNRVAVALDNENGILDNIKAFTPQTNKLLLVANDPDDYEDNDAKLAIIEDSFDKSGLHFKSTAVLDNRNKTAAAQTICSADLMILSGGKCFCQNKFFKSIGMKKLLENHNGLTIGISAGTMNLCKFVANFPEEKSDLSDPLWFKGMGIFEDTVIPHFDGSTKTYQLPCDEIDVVNDYILPMSHKRDFLGLPNGAYILIDNNRKISYFGDLYKISCGTVTELR